MNKNEDGSTASLDIEYCDNIKYSDSVLSEFLENSLSKYSIEEATGMVQQLVENAPVREVSIVHPVNQVFANKLNWLLRKAKHPAKVHYSHLQRPFAGSTANWETDFSVDWPNDPARMLWELKNIKNIKNLKTIAESPCITDITDQTQSKNAKIQKSTNTQGDTAPHWPIRQVYTNMIIRGSRVGMLDSIEDKYAFVRSDDLEMIESPKFTLDDVEDENCVNYFQAKLLLIAMSDYFEKFSPKEIQKSVILQSKTSTKTDENDVKSPESQESDTNNQTQMSSESNRKDDKQSNTKHDSNAPTASLVIDGLRSCVEGKGTIGVQIAKLEKENESSACVAKIFNLNDRDTKKYYENERRAYDVLRGTNTSFSLLGVYRFADDDELNAENEMLVIERDENYLTLEKFLEKNKRLNCGLARTHDNMQSDLLEMKKNVVKAYTSLHKRGVVQNDVKGDNILICDGTDVKIIDFSHAIFDASQQQIAKETEDLKAYLDDAAGEVVATWIDVV